MEAIFDILNTAQKASQIALDTQGRSIYPMLGVVSDNQDPENKRRVKVVLSSSPGLNSYWLRRLLPNPQIDPPLPAIGQTVMVLFAEGLETNGYYLQIVNNTNPARQKDSPVNDHSELVPGNRDVEIGGDDDLVVEKNVTYEAKEDILIKAGKSIKFQTDSGAYLELSQTGAVTLADAFGHKWTLGGGVGGNSWVWDAAGANINVINANDFTIEGKSILVVGSVDSDGDINQTRGY